MTVVTISGDEPNQRIARVKKRKRGLVIRIRTLNTGRDSDEISMKIQVPAEHPKKNLK